MMQLPIGTEALQAALSSDNLSFAWLIELPNSINLTTHVDDISLNGNTYVSQGQILSISSVVREKEIRLHGLNLNFSSVEDVLQTRLLERNLTGETCKLLLVLLDDSGVVLDGYCINMFQGRFDSWTLADSGKTATISIKITSSWSKPEGHAGRMTNPSDQQARYEGDKFFQYAHESREAIKWGREG